MKLAAVIETMRIHGTQKRSWTRSLLTLQNHKSASKFVPSGTNCLVKKNTVVLNLPIAVTLMKERIMNNKGIHILYVYMKYPTPRIRQNGE